MLTIACYIFMATNNPIKAEQINFQIDPMLLQIEIKPGSQFNYEYKVSGSKNIEYIIQPKAFIPKDKIGNLKSLNETPDFLDWIDYSKTEIYFNNDKEIISVQMKINVPIEVELKDYYFVTSVSSKEIENNQTGNILSGEIQSPVLLTIEDISKPSARNGKISSFNTNFFNSQKPINFDLVLENTGDLLFKSSGYIEIQNLITKQITKENLLPQNVLAHSSRQIFNTTQTDKYPYLTWYPETLFGIFKAEAKIKYPSTSTVNLLELNSVPIYFIYIDFYLLILILTLFFFLVTIIIFKNRRSYSPLQR
ncbi:hypothetical protein A2296_00950 [candidate division CPR3 bacterium RIFOXYB2_FULL_35_8]|uniref:Uncharacterized protein n=1 Tax=candidate division CPR3 bacterium GW2011_GWF2_35_18 TaxID=1618350 RepID=A0A0G0BJ20_UNCC3|nr:MAG: hypothetical protein UR67_C0006G0005 [candidate division CPR3 bacterium GW2011_GWF2_35_18]KKP86765.1 MAG: hypothetical protein UR87_C0011G0005 [candidate division CPR3 bacterium GW2011_GWE2_35_7]OGB65963.1 MAG: hypothetical protein A2250_03615 [candidate division CPR3 bacterium RIFOXYA2_FULL_35_13]OGB75722.1 MAG: hypothetical protein A2476_05260 [candidate division CPR3 bacterium RIFOXYC2_FULL_35_7]OGB79179.1 MAG: hypothetical protein A2296_00950 [candidate division CPR3 bacterium RIFOX